MLPLFLIIMPGMISRVLYPGKGPGTGGVGIFPVTRAACLKTWALHRPGGSAGGRGTGEDPGVPGALLEPAVHPGENGVVFLGEVMSRKKLGEKLVSMTWKM